jgi:hypothetical protein
VDSSTKAELKTENHGIEFTRDSPQGLPRLSHKWALVLPRKCGAGQISVRSTTFMKKTVC